MLFFRIQRKSWQPCFDPSIINRKKSEQINADVKNDFSFKLNSFYGPTQFLKKNLQLVSNDVIWCLYSLSVLWGSLRKPTLKDRTEIWKSNPCCNMNVLIQIKPSAAPTKEKWFTLFMCETLHEVTGQVNTMCVYCSLHLGWQVFCEYSLSTGIRRLGESVDSLFILTTLIMNMLKSKQDTQLWICPRNYINISPGKCYLAEDSVGGKSVNWYDLLPCQCVPRSPNNVSQILQT